MDLSKIQPIHKKFENELQAEKYLARLSMAGGKKVDIIQIYPKGSFIYVWFYYDRTRLDYVNPKTDGDDKAEKVTKKKTRKKRKKKVVS